MSEVAAEWVPIGVLVPWADNPRYNEHAVDKIVKSIQEFGWAEVIVARRADHMVIAGHTRLLAAKKMGMKTVPVRYLDIDAAKAKQLAIASNKLGELSAWDDEKLNAILADLASGLDDFDPELLGFSRIEVEAYQPKGEPGATGSGTSGGGWGGGTTINPDAIGQYDPANETFVIKVEKIKACDRDAVLAAMTAAMTAAGFGYAVKAF